MQIPQELIDQFQQKTGEEPQATARAIYDLEGNLGETYAAANESELMLFSRQFGRPYEVKHFKLADVAHLAVDCGTVFAHFELKAEGGHWRLQCSCWDTPELETIRAFWQQVRLSSPSSERPTVPRAGSPASSAEAPALRPLAVFCAAIHAMIECDDNIDVTELNYLTQRIPNLGAIQQGQAFYQSYRLETVLVRAQKALNGDQQRCLFANLVAVAMADGLLRSREQELIEQFRVAMGIVEEQADDIFAALMTKNNLSIFIEDTGTGLVVEEGLTPIVAFCAAVQAMMQTDEMVAREEREFIERVIPDPEAIKTGEEYLEAYRLDHLLQRLPAVLNTGQQRCLMANLLALAMVEGRIAPEEQKLLTRFQHALAVTDDEYQQLHDLLVLKDNLSVFS